MERQTLSTREIPPRDWENIYRTADELFNALRSEGSEVLRNYVDECMPEIFDICNILFKALA